MNNPPNINQLWREYPHKVLRAYSQQHGPKIISNSRLGHTEIAAGRPVPQDLAIINQKISDKSFYRNHKLVDCFKYAKEHNSNVHFLGLISDAGINSHLDHLIALLEMAHRQNFSRIFIDAITDGLDCELSALKFITIINKKIQEIGIGSFSSIMGRSWAINNSLNFPSLEKVYRMLIEGQAPRESSPEIVITKNYQAGRQDFQIPPTLIKIKDSVQTIKAFDVVVFFNFRAGRARALAKFLTGKVKRLFWRPQLPEGMVLATFTQFSHQLVGPVIFPRDPLSDILPSVFARHQKRNLRLTETIKKAHVTYFFNGGRKEPFAYEERQIFPSAKVESFVLAPAMSGVKITQAGVAAIASKKYDFILINFPNADILGHTGNIIAAGQAVLAVDRFLGKIVEANLKAGGATIITADHGNVEQMVKTQGLGKAFLRHTDNPVPFILIAQDRKKNLIQGALTFPYSTLSKIVTAKSNLADIAPTILELMNLPKPEVMTGHSLLSQLE